MIPRRHKLHTIFNRDTLKKRKKISQQRAKHITVATQANGGLAANSFKQRYANHLQPFTDRYHEKDRIMEIFNENFRIFNEKLGIVPYTQNNLLNKKIKLITKCHHQNKYALLCYDWVET